MTSFKNVSLDGQPDEMSEHRKALLCQQWVDFCRSIGWKRDALPHLVDLFWKHEGWRTFKGWPR